MDIIKQHYIVDLSSNNNFVQISGMQGDGYQVRYAEIELIQNGVRYIPDPNEVYIDIMGTKPDTKEVWNECTLTSEGYILVEITQQMLAVPGRGDYVINLIHKLNNRQLKSFPFILITVKAPYDPLYIESTDEFQRLVAVIDTSEKYAEEAEQSAAKALVSEQHAKASENAAKASEQAAKASETVTKNWANLSKSYAVGTNGTVREGDATDNSKSYSERSREYSINSANSAVQSKTYRDQSEDMSERSKSYAVGTNGIYREGDATDNSEYYSRQSRNSAISAEQILENTIKAGEDAVKAIQEALDIDAPNFVMDLETGHLKYEGGRFNFEVHSNGHLMWGLTV